MNSVHACILQCSQSHGQRIHILQCTQVVRHGDWTVHSVDSRPAAEQDTVHSPTVTHARRTACGVWCSIRVFHIYAAPQPRDPGRRQRACDGLKLYSVPGTHVFLNRPPTWEDGKFAQRCWAAVSRGSKNATSSGLIRHRHAVYVEWMDMWMYDEMWTDAATRLLGTG